MVDTDSLAGQTVVVIGGTRNIGLEIARRAADAGASVVITGRDSASAEAAAADLPAATGIALDLDDEASIAAAAASIPAIDHVVITAAAHHNAAVTELEKDKIFGAFQAKVVGPLLVAKHFAPKMSAGGSMVLFSGVVAWRPSAPLQCHGDHQWRGAVHRQRSGEGTGAHPGECGLAGHHRFRGLGQDACRAAPVLLRAVRAERPGWSGRCSGRYCRRCDMAANSGFRQR